MKKAQIDPAVYLRDITDAIDRIFTFTADGIWEKTLYAVERALTIIGEAGRRIPDAIKEGARYVPWNEINGLRNLLIHEYEHISSAILKDIRETHLMPLKVSVERLLTQLKDK